jgi:hypothetical protein
MWSSSVESFFTSTSMSNPYTSTFLAMDQHSFQS